MQKLYGLKEDFKQQVDALMTRLDQLGIKYYITEGIRSKEVQAAYYAQGREPLVTVNRLRSVAGLRPLTEKENKKQITWTLKSKHLIGEAIDIVPINPETNKLWWTAPFEIWESIGEVAEEFGLEWGGRWKQKDVPHIQTIGSK